MVIRQIKIVFAVFITLCAVLLMQVSTAGADKGQLQEAVTPSATSPVQGPQVQVTFDNDEVNVRSGPGTDYDKVATIPAGTVLTATGKSAASLWVQVYLPDVPGQRGWIYANLLIFLTTGEVPIIEPPSSPTPLVTVTIDQTLAAQFVTEPPPTRLPTFTPPPPLVVPTLPESSPSPLALSFPRGAVIVLFAILGVLGLLISFLIKR